MELDVVCEFFKCVLVRGIKYDKYIGDDDLIIFVYFKINVFYGFEKIFDFIYIKCFLNIRLYNLS